MDRCCRQQIILLLLLVDTVVISGEQTTNYLSDERGDNAPYHSSSDTEKHSVLRLRTNNLKQFLCIKKLFDISVDLKVNFWKTARSVNDTTDIMVPSSSLLKIQRFLKECSVNITVIIDDVERLIIDREFSSRFEQQRYKDDLAPEPATSKYDFFTYGSYDQMMKWMHALAQKYPNIVRYISIGKTHEGRSIDGLEIGGGNQTKRVFWIDGGIHAREWAAPHTALYFIHQLVSRYGHDSKITDYVDELTWVIVPCLNPDGYEFTRSSTNPNIRLWRKNRSPSMCAKDPWGRNRCCRGVDLNRNFDFHFKETGSSDDPCAEIYQGKKPFSEPESRAVSDALLSNRYRGRVDAFVTLHTYSQIWIHPFGHRKDTYPGDIQDLYDVGKKAASELSKVYGTKYVVGSGADTLYPASGGSEDWAKQTASVKYVYLLELRPDERNFDGFILDERLLMPTATETWAGIQVVADAVIDRVKHKNAKANDSRQQAVSLRQR